MAQKETPFSAESLATDTDNGDQLERRLERYSIAKKRSFLMSQYIFNVPDVNVSSDIDLQDKAYKLLKCGAWLHFKNYYTTNEYRLVDANFCKQHLLCPFCAIRRGSKHLGIYHQKYLQLIEENPRLKPYLVTLTVKNGSNLFERFNHIKKSFKILQTQRSNSLKGNRSKVEFSKAFAAVWSYENKRGEGSGLWHPHSHGLWLCEEEPDLLRLRNEWHSITGDSFMVDCRPVTSEGGFIEVFKYALKFSDLPLEDNLEAYKVLSGKKLLGSCGGFRGLPEPEKLTDDELDSLPFVDLFFKYLSSGRYGKTDSSVKEQDFKNF